MESDPPPTSAGQVTLFDSNVVCGVPREWFILRLRTRIREAIASQRAVEERVTKTVMHCFQSTGDSNGEPLHIANVTAALPFPYAPLNMSDLTQEASEDPLIMCTVLQVLLARFLSEQAQSLAPGPTGPAAPQPRFTWALDSSIMDLSFHFWKMRRGPASETPKHDSGNHDGSRASCLGRQIFGFASSGTGVDEQFIASWWEGFSEFSRSTELEIDDKLPFLFWIICWLWNGADLGGEVPGDLLKIAIDGVVSVLNQPPFCERSRRDPDKNREQEWIDAVLAVIQHPGTPVADRLVALNSLALIYCEPWAIPLVVRSEPNSDYPSAALQWSCFHVPVLCGLAASLQQPSRMEVVATVDSLLPMGLIVVADCVALRLLCSPSLESVAEGVTETNLSFLRRVATRLKSVDRRLLVWCAAADAADRIALLAVASSAGDVPPIVQTWQSKQFSQVGFAPIRWVGVPTQSPEIESQESPCLPCLYGESGVPGLIPPLPLFDSIPRILCSRCRKVSYCSLECLLRNWPEHESVCGKGKVKIASSN